MHPYVTRQGDYLTQLAHAMGFDADAVWNDPANDALRARRPHPDILCPGDVLYLPAAPTRPGLRLRPGQIHRYRATRARVAVRVTLAAAGRPLAGVAYEVHGVGAVIRGTTGDDGSVTFAAPAHSAELELHLPERGVIYPLLVGHLDPVDEPSGVRARLANLGYHPAPAAAGLRHALEDFQADHHLAVTGALDADTKRALTDAHGC